MSTEYKKGDRVRRINSDNGAYGAKVGQEGTVVSTSKGFVYVDYRPRSPLCTQQREPEGWRLENATLVQPVFKVGDKIAYRHTPDKQAGEVVAVVPGAHPACRLVVLMNSKTLSQRYENGKVYDIEQNQNDFVLVSKPVVTKKVWITSWINESGSFRCFSYQEKNHAEACKATQMKHGYPASVTEVDVTVDPN